MTIPSTAVGGASEQAAMSRNVAMERTRAQSAGHETVSLMSIS